MTKVKTRSDYKDVIIFLSILLLMLILSPRLRVYYRPSPAFVSLKTVNSSEKATSITPPEQFDGPQKSFHNTLRRIREFSQTDASNLITPRKGYLEWTIHYDTRVSKERPKIILITNKSND